MKKLTVLMSAAVLASSLVLPAAASAAETGPAASAASSDQPLDVEPMSTSWSHFSCLLPRTGTFTHCASTIKDNNARIDVRNNHSGGRTVRVRARDANNNGSNGVAISPGQRRTIMNEGPGTHGTYNIQARVSIPGVRVQFEGTYFVVR